MKFVRSSLLVKLVILIVVVYAVVTLVSLRNQIADKNAEAAALTSSITAVEQKNGKLEEAIATADSDEGVEAIARDKLGMVTDEQAKANYAEHEGKPFYEGLISYITSGPVVKMVVSGEGAVAKCRSLMGATNPAEAAPGTIRGDFGLIMDENVIHGSDSPESAEREIGIFFE